MAEAHNYENYHDRTPTEPSKLKQFARSFGRAAGRALQMFGGPIPPGTFNPALYAHPPEKEERAEVPTGRAITLPATYNYESGMRSQPPYAGRVYDKKGSSVIPLDLIWEHDTLIAVYNMDQGARRRYLVVQKVPELRTGVATTEEMIKFAEVYEYPQAETRFICKGTREATISDPELTRSLMVGGNYGAGSRLTMVLGLTPQHDTRAFSDDSTNEERSLAYSLYEVERALLEHETKVNSRFI